MKYSVNKQLHKICFLLVHFPIIALSIWGDKEMKKQFLWALFGLMTALFIVYTFSKESNNHATSSPQDNQNILGTSQNITSASKTIESSAKTTSEDSPKQMLTEKELCLSEGQLFSKMSDKDLLSKIETGDLNFDSKCLKHLMSDEELEANSNLLFCFEKKQNPENISKCFQSMFTLKSMISYEENKNKILSQMSEEDLVHGVFALLSNPDEVERLKQMIEELKKRKPYDPAVAKLALFPVGIEGIEAINEHLAQNFENAKKLNPDDPQIVELEMYLAVEHQKTEKNLEAHLTDYSRRNPNDGRGYYFAAGSAYRKGQYDRMLGYLQQAVQANPESERFRTALNLAEGSINSADINWLTLDADPKDFINQ